ncbi:MAG: hypothetical protein V3T49_01170, partial [Dehalococcoidia bacterium]
MADANIAFSQQVLDISNAEIEAIVEPNRMLDDRRRESMSFIDVLHLDMLPEGYLICQYLMRDPRPFRRINFINLPVPIGERRNPWEGFVQYLTGKPARRLLIYYT